MLFCFCLDFFLAKTFERNLGREVGFYIVVFCLDFFFGKNTEEKLGYERLVSIYIVLFLFGFLVLAKILKKNWGRRGRFLYCSLFFYFFWQKH